MNRKLLLLFNHRITADQESDAYNSLSVSSIVEPPERIKAVWRQVPPELQTIDGYLQPVKEWLYGQASPGDYLLVQGDFGATYLMVRFGIEIGMIPVYATTERQVEEVRLPDGTISATHAFRHVRYREYEP